MRRKMFVVLALVLVFALMFTACAVRRPLQNPVQPRNSTTGMYDNNRGTGVGTGVGTRTGLGNRTGIGNTSYTGNGPSSSDTYDLGFGAGNNAGYGRYGAGSGTNYGNYGGYGTGTNAGNVGYNGYYNGGNMGYNGVSYGNTAGNPTYYGGYDNGLYGGYGVDYRNIGGSNNSANYGLNNTGRTSQASGIERAVEQMTGVRDATVVVSGNTAYVGLDTSGSMTGQNISYGSTTGTSALKQACARRVKASNPQIQTVYVSTDTNFINRLRRVGDGVNTGNTVTNFRNELSDLVRGLTPER